MLARLECLRWAAGRESCAVARVVVTKRLLMAALLRARRPGRMGVVPLWQVEIW